jgi:Uma2 family endonuclease
MSASALPRMTADQFLAWATEQPDAKHYELVAGEIVAMAPERVGHLRAKMRVTQRLTEAIARAGLPCEAFIHGVIVQVDHATIYEPDAMVRCGPPLGDDTIKVTDPMIVVEVLSPSTSGVDTGTKLIDYFRIPLVRHYLIVRAERRTIIHHARNEAGDISTRIVSDGVLSLDPPCIELRDLFT